LGKQIVKIHREYKSHLQSSTIFSQTINIYSFMMQREKNRNNTL